MATMRFGLPINMLDDFEAERAEQDWNGFPVPLVAHDYAVQIAEAVGDPVPEPYEGLRPYDGLCWEIVQPAVNYVASFYGQSAAKRLRWIGEADYTNVLNCELFPHWQREAVRYAMAAAHAARLEGGQ